MSESVEWRGQALYAPVLACRPVRIDDYPPERRAVWDKVATNVGTPLNIYPGSTYQLCEDCAIEIAVGPRQQAAVESATHVGLAAHVCCMLCAGARAAEAEADGDEMDVISMGNPFKKEKP